MMRHHEDDAAFLTARDGQKPGKSGRSVTDTPYYLPVEVKGVLWLSREECIEILKRGRRWRKVMANWNPKRSA